ASTPTTPASASASHSPTASPKHTTEPSPSPPETKADSTSPSNYPPRHPPTVAEWVDDRSEPPAVFVTHGRRLGRGDAPPDDVVRVLDDQGAAGSAIDRVFAVRAVGGNPRCRVRRTEESALQSGRPDLNRRPSVPQTDALTRLRHAPYRGRG